MGVCDGQEFVGLAAPLHRSVPPERGEVHARWRALYDRFPAEAFARRLGWLPDGGDPSMPAGVSARAGSDPESWCRWLRDRSWVDGGDGADGLSGWAAAHLPRPAAHWRPSVTEDLRRHLAGEIREILGTLGGFSPRNGLTGEELVGLAVRRPALTRLLGTRVELWRAASAELRRRYDQDRGALVAVMFEGRDPGPLVRIEAGLGDSHDGFRTVAALTFAGGDRVVYKPRSLDVESAWAELAGWINHEAGGSRVRAHRVLLRPGYGWAEFVVPDARRPDDQAEPVIWYRAGWLLAVLHVLGASDCHGGNVVLTQGWPHVIDLETLLTPRHRLEDLVELDRSAAAVAAARRLRRSVLAACILPAWAAAEEGELYLGAFDIPVDGPGRQAFKAGFNDGYGFLLERRATLMAHNGPLRRLSSAELRVILRPTRVYTSVRRASLAAGGVSGATRGLAFETLVAPLLDLDDALARAVARAEIDALDAGDVPRIVIQADSSDARCGGRSVPGLCPESAWSEVQARVGGLSAEAGRAQAELIDLALDVAAARAAPARPARRLFEADLSVAPAELQRAATTIAAELCRTAERAADGSAAWVGVAFNPTAGAPAIVPTDATLYSGGAGIAIFLAAAAKATGRDEFADLAVAALSPHPWQREAEAARAFRALPVGGYVGVASILYGWEAVGRVLGRQDLVDAAMERSGLLTPARIAADRQFDRVGGVAGAIPVLVGLYHHSGEKSLLERIRACGERLLASARPGGEDSLCWPARGRPALCGMSHGAAGVTLSLLQAWAVTGEHDLWEGAMAGRRFEDGRFDPSRRNWPDRRAASDEAIEGDMCSWCHGAPGIALARAAMAGFIPGAWEDPMLDAAVATTRARRLPGGHLCCGEGGIADILLELGGRLGRPDLVEAGRARLGGLIHAWRTEGRFPLNPQAPPRAPVPGLMQGVAGVGLALLRAAGAEAPSVLLLE